MGFMDFKVFGISEIKRYRLQRKVWIGGIAPLEDEEVGWVVRCLSYKHEDLSSIQWEKPQPSVPGPHWPASVA